MTSKYALIPLGEHDEGPFLAGLPSTLPGVDGQCRVLTTESPESFWTVLQKVACLSDLSFVDQVLEREVAFQNVPVQLMPSPVVCHRVVGVLAASDSVVACSVSQSGSASVVGKVSGCLSDSGFFPLNGSVVLSGSPSPSPPKEDNNNKKKVVIPDSDLDSASVDPYGFYHDDEEESRLGFMVASFRNEMNGALSRSVSPPSRSASTRTYASASHNSSQDSSSRAGGKRFAGQKPFCFQRGPYRSSCSASTPSGQQETSNGLDNPYASTPLSPPRYGKWFTKRGQDLFDSDQMPSPVEAKSKK